VARTWRSGGDFGVTDPRGFYTGWLVDPAQRESLLQRLPARYANVVAHHVTLKFGDRHAEPPQATHGRIVGEADDGAGVQAMVVEIGGGVERPDGGVFHITWSLAAGREAKESNDVISSRGWETFDAPISVRLIARQPD
jgi:hypothetical protein